MNPGVASFQIKLVSTSWPILTPPVPAKYRNQVYRSDFGWIERPGDIMMDQNNIVRSFIPPHIRRRYGRFSVRIRPERAFGLRSGHNSGRSLAGHTSKRFHESRHGADWFDYLGKTRRDLSRW